MKIRLTFGLLVALTLTACSATPPLDIEPIGQHLCSEFRVSDSNRYAILMSGKLFQLASPNGSVSNIQSLQKQTPLEDPYVNTDMQQLKALLTNKSYDVYHLDFSKATLDDLDFLLRDIIEASNESTRLFIAYSGEGDSKGLRPCALKINQSQILIPSNSTIDPKYFFSILHGFKGTTAVVINACESGVFVDEAPEDFLGVIFTACPVGTKTTPYEPDGTTAIFSTFLRLYEEDPYQQLDLMSVEIDEVGGWWTNFLHKLFAPSGIKISYNAVVLKTHKFPL